MYHIGCCTLWEGTSARQVWRQCLPGLGWNLSPSNSVAMCGLRFPEPFNHAPDELAQINLLLVVICLGNLMVELPQADDGPPELVPDDDDGPQALLHLPPPDVGPEGCLLLPDSDDGMEILCSPCRVPLPMQCCAKDCRHSLWDCNRDLLSEHKANL